MRQIWCNEVCELMIVSVYFSVPFFLASKLVFSLLSVNLIFHFHVFIFCQGKVMSL
jgi:hypothetical protein